MTWSQTELDALRSAFAAGTLRVTYDGRTVEYGDAGDLLKRIRTIEREMAAAGRDRLVTMKPTRGTSSPGCHSTLATTRRFLSQLPA
jgi:hypothetical protein